MNSCTISKEGSMVASGLTDSTIRLWTLRNKANTDEKSVQSENGNSIAIRLVGHSQPPSSLDFSHDERFLLSASGDCSIRLWMVGNGANVVAYKGHNYPVWDVCFSPLDFYFASASK